MGQVAVCIRIGLHPAVDPYFPVFDTLAETAGRRQAQLLDGVANCARVCAMDMVFDIESHVRVY